MLFVPATGENPGLTYDANGTSIPLPEYFVLIFHTDLKFSGRHCWEFYSLNMFLIQQIFLFLHVRNSSESEISEKKGKLIYTFSHV
jgi:hypothetical protein